MYRIISSHPEAAEAKLLIRELSNKLAEITGDDGTSSFGSQDADQPGAEFLVLYRDELPVGCGALRPLAKGVCEVKRMYSRHPGQGIGKRLLGELERLAAEMGYESVWLSTRRVNQKAVDFYLSQGYEIRSNYGRYQGREESICFKKDLAAAGARNRR